MLCLQAERRTGHAHHARRRLRVASGGLGGGQSQRRRRRGGAAGRSQEEAERSIHLDWVAERRAGTVHLQDAYLRQGTKAVSNVDKMYIRRFNKEASYTVLRALSVQTCGPMGERGFRCRGGLQIPEQTTSLFIWGKDTGRIPANYVRLYIRLHGCRISLQQ